MRRWIMCGMVAALLASAGCHSTEPAGRPASVGTTQPSSPTVHPPRSARTTDRASVRSGQPFRLYVTSTAGAFTVRAFRLGWYGGSGARLLWTSPAVPGRAQPAPTIGPDRMVRTNWKPTLTVPTTGWPAGAYLLLLTAANGKEKYVPITVRSNSTRGAVVIMDAVNTYQAYNAWGGYSLYHGPNKSFATRSYRVTFYRPYDREAVPGLSRSRPRHTGTQDQSKDPPGHLPRPAAPVAE